MSIRYSERAAKASIEPPVGSVCGSYDKLPSTSPSAAKLQWKCRESIAKITPKKLRAVLLDSHESNLVSAYRMKSSGGLGEIMGHERNDMTSDIDLRPIVGLLSNESEHVIEALTVNAIKRHRTLVDRAERLFQSAHSRVRGVDKQPGDAHVAYLEATIEMHAQMSALTTLLNILGRTPEV